MKWIFKALWLGLLFLSSNVQAQQDSTTIWVNTQNGNIYTLDVHNGCTAQLYCATGKEDIMDIAHTPNGNLYGNTWDSLYRIFPNGQTTVIGKIPNSADLVGLNDSTLFITSQKQLLSVNTNTAETKLIGYIGYTSDGDLTWIGNKLLTFAGGRLLKIHFNDSFTNILRVDSTFRDTSYYTPALATTYLDTVGYTLIAFPGNIQIYRVDTNTAIYQQICVNHTTVPIFGASTLIFPPQKKTTSIASVVSNQNSFIVYPNPTAGLVSIEVDNFSGKINELEVLCYDVFGRIISKDYFSTSKIEIDMGNLTQGIYPINIRYRYKTIYSTKLLKK